MLQVKRFSAFFLAVLLVSMLGCASTSTREGTGEYVDDTVITTKVKAAIRQRAEMPGFPRTRECHKSVV